MGRRLKICMKPAATLALFLLFAVQTAWTQGQDYIKSNYTKSEYAIVMRDGIKLFTAVYTPKDASRKYPIMLNRTPYSVAPYGVENYPLSLGPSEKFVRDGFIFACQDVRGRMMSGGEFLDVRPHKPVKNGPADIDESTDTFDTIDWLVKSIRGNNGRVGMWGISYPGFYSAAGMIDAHPALKAVSPQAPIADWFIGDDFHHNGALYLAHAFGFFSGFGRARPQPTARAADYRFDYGTPDGYNFFLELGPLSQVNEKYFKGEIAFWNELLLHGSYDEFWQARNLRPHLKSIRPAVMTVGGWFDAEDLFGALNTYRSVEQQSPGTYNILVMGPWYHGGWSRSDGDALGSVRFASKTGAFYRDEIEFPFFNFFLKDSGENKLPEAYVFETGRNEWRRQNAWPPKETRPRSLFLQSAGKLSFDLPADDAASAYDEYISDPSKPVPYINSTATGMTREHMVDDQRFAAHRTDVLAYQTEELAGDVTLAGPITASLQVSTTGTDSDWIVKLIDVYPNSAPDNQPNPTEVRMGGYQQLVRGEAMRGKFRNSYSLPEPFVPGEVSKVEYIMPDVYHTFRRGHRIMVQIQSSWFPLVDRNPQQFLDIYSAKPGDFIKATQRVYRGAAAGSCLKVLVLE